MQALGCIPAVLCWPAMADPFDVGPWSVAVDPNRAVAGLDDPTRTWTLFVRCVEGHLDLLVRRRAALPTEQASINHSAGSLQVDGGPPTSFPAQTWSLDGFLVPDAGATLPSIEAGRQLDFAFVDGVRHSSMSFLASDTKVALHPVRQKCKAPSS